MFYRSGFAYQLGLLRLALLDSRLTVVSSTRAGSQRGGIYVYSRRGATPTFRLVDHVRALVVLRPAGCGADLRLHDDTDPWRVPGRRLRLLSRRVDSVGPRRQPLRLRPVVAHRERALQSAPPRAPGHGGLLRAGSVL